MARKRATAKSAPTKGRAAGTPDVPKKQKKVRWYHQVWQAYQMTREADPAVTWWMLLVLVGALAIGIGLGFAFLSPVYGGVVALPFGVLGAMFLLARRAERAAFRRIEGQPGAARAALGTIRRGWSFPEEPVAIDPRSQDLVFRGVGRPGVLLVSEGPPNRAGRLLENERKRTARVLPSVPIHLIQCGNGEGQVPLHKLPQAVRKLKPTLTRHEVAAVDKRLTALGGARLPIPKGIDPTRMRPDRRAIRGR